MTGFVEECRREWKRLGVPDSMAEEMATELESDLVEAEADGVSTVEMLGESDPRRFAATWARERGLITEPAPKRSRKWLWIGVAAALVLLFVALPSLALIGTGSGSISTVRSPKVVRSVVTPNLVGMRACHAKRIALESGLKVHPFSRRRCNAVVVGQHPLPGTLIEWPRGARTRVTLRLLRLRG